jgi:hypothetical protein
MAFFSKNNVTIKCLQKVEAVLAKKRQYFRQISRRKFLKNHYIGSRVFGMQNTIWMETLTRTWQCRFLFTKSGLEDFLPTTARVATCLLRRNSFRSQSYDRELQRQRCKNLQRC